MAGYENLRVSPALSLAAACVPFKPTTKNDVFPGRAQLPQEEAPHLKNSLEWWYYHRPSEGRCDGRKLRGGVRLLPLQPPTASRTTRW
ncbi:MAG: hypothetical protein WKG07_26640 [Hymenobacter sp.]